VVALKKIDWRLATAIIAIILAFLAGSIWRRADVVFDERAVEIPLSDPLRKSKDLVRLLALNSAPLVRMLPGARNRERVVDPLEEAKYLSASPDPLAAIAAILLDTGLRPEECFRLRWESITWFNGRRHSACNARQNRGSTARPTNDATS
jgi:integrase